MRRVFGVLLAGTLSALLVLGSPARSQAANLASTPYMGWNTYYGLGGHFDEADIKSVANSLLSTGLAQAGYKIVWLDAGWATGARDSTGQLTVDPSKWPDGMAGLTSWLHQQGLEAGIYTDAGTSGCAGQGVGSYGHYQQDADTFAAWGFDAVKMDFCGAGQASAAGQLSATPQQLYTQFATALANNSSHRPMLLNVDNFWMPGQINGTAPTLANSSWDNYQWAPQISQSWRTDTDVGFTRNVQFQWVMRNLDLDAAHPEAAGPGHWNDPDYLGPGLGMTSTEAQSQFSMWAMLAAPLMLGSDPRTLAPATISMLENTNVIGIDQDSLGAQATVFQQSGPEQAWSKPLVDGSRAVALLNRGTTPLPVSTTAGAAGLPQASGYTVQDLWTNATTTTNGAGTITAAVPAHGVALYRVTPSGTPGEPPGIATLTARTAGTGLGSVHDNTSAISCLGACAAQYRDGTAVTLTATPFPGFIFTGWSGGGCSGTRSCTVTLTADTDVTATFAPGYTLSVSLTGDGSGTVSDNTGGLSCPVYCSTGYGIGASALLTATPSPGSAFAGWSGGGCSGTGTCALGLSSDTTVAARFIQVRTLTVSVIGRGAGRVSAPGISCPGTCSASYPVGTPVTLDATPASGSQLGAWLSGGCPAAGTRCTRALSNDVNVTVAFDLPRPGFGYVLDPRRDAVTPIDLATDATERRITGFHDPRYIAITPDGGTAYVVNPGNNTVTPINLATDATEPPITGFERPGPIAISPNGKTAYVLEGNRTLVPIDLVTDQREAAITFTKRSGIGNQAASIALTPDGRRAYLGTFAASGRRSTGTVAAVVLATGRVKAIIRRFADPAGLAITPSGRTAYVADSVRGDVTPINLVNNRRIKAPALTAVGTFPAADAVAITPDGGSAYVATRAGAGVIHVATNTAQWVPTAEANGIAITPNGGTAYLASANTDSLIPIDLATSTERPAVTRLASPSAVAITLPPPRGYSVRLSTQPKWNGHTVSDTVTCTSPTRACTTTQTLTASGRGRLLGKRRVRIPPGRTVKVVVALSAPARQLVNSGTAVPVVLGLAILRGGQADTVATRKLTL